VILNLLIAFAGGLISFLSPCILPLIPGYVAYISGQPLDKMAEDKRNIILRTTFFTLGFSIIFISFGITASFIGKLLINYSNYLRIFSGIIIILFSFQLVGLLNFKFLNSELRFFTKKNNNNIFFPIIIGMAFGFGWTPCIGPILGSILAIASLENRLTDAIILLSFYSLGLAIPFIISGYAIHRFIYLSKKIRIYMPRILKAGGIILFITGILILTNNLQILGFYLIEFFPFFSNIG